jgi:hypothetical protein
MFRLTQLPSPRHQAISQTSGVKALSIPNRKDFTIGDRESRIVSLGEWAQNNKAAGRRLVVELSLCHQKFWSGRRDSNPRPRPWQGRALPLSYTRIREIGGDHSPATRRAMPNAALECNSPRAISESTE